MVKCKCIQKFRDKHNNIYGYRIVDNQGNTKDITSEQLKTAIKAGQVDVSNLKLTSNDRLVDSNILGVKNNGVYKQINTEDKRKYDSIIELTCRELEFPRGKNKLTKVDGETVTYTSGGINLLGDTYVLNFEFKTGTTITLSSNSVNISGAGLSYKEQIRFIGDILKELKKIHTISSKLGFGVNNIDINITTNLLESYSVIEATTSNQKLANVDFNIYFETSNLDGTFNKDRKVALMSAFDEFEHFTLEIEYPDDDFNTQIKKIQNIINKLNNINNMNERDVLNLCAEMSELTLNGNHPEEVISYLLRRFVPNKDKNILRYLDKEIKKLIKTNTSDISALLDKLEKEENEHSIKLDRVKDIQYIGVYCVVYNVTPKDLLTTDRLDLFSIELLKEDWYWMF